MATTMRMSTLPFDWTGSRITRLLLACFLCLVSTSRAWISLPRRTVSKNQPYIRRDPNLASSSSPDADPSGRQPSAPPIRRLRIVGVSVSSDGFWVVLQVPQEGYWPIQITSDPQDAAAAQSAESLTLIQLLNGVDMATPILPPEVLSQLAVLYAEENDVSEITDLVELPEDIASYADTNKWQRSRLRLPKVTLDQVQLVEDSFILECTGPKTGPFSFSPILLEEVSYTYDPDTSCAFLCLALALRYRAPLTLLSSPSEETSIRYLDSEEAVRDRFPMYTTVDNLRQSSERVQSNIARGFEIHKLTGALRIAMERGDEVAVKNIREALDEYDSMDELPTLGDETSDTDQMQ